MNYQVELVGIIAVRYSVEVSAESVQAAEKAVQVNLPTDSACWEHIHGSVSNIEVETITEIKPDTSDEGLSADQLMHKYTPEDRWGEHPTYRASDWRHQVSESNTRASYWDWVYNEVQNELVVRRTTGLLLPDQRQGAVV